MIMRFLPCFLICIILMLNTSEAQLNLISTLDPAEDLSSNLDLSVGDLSNSENLFLSNDQSFSGPDSEFLTGNTNPNSDGSLLGTSPGSNILDSNDEASFAFLTATGESCSLDPSSKVKRQNGEACLPGVENPASLLENYQLQPGVLTPELIKKMIRTIPYGIALSLASDYTWCDPTNQRNYAVCDSGFSYDRIPLPTPPFYDLFDCSQCNVLPLPFPPPNSPP